MILASKDSGADFAKPKPGRQKIKNGDWDNYRRKYMKKLNYQKINIMLKDFCESNNIEFLSSAFSIPDAQLLVK